MVYTTVVSEITEEERRVIKKLLLEKKYNKSLFLQLMDPIVQDYFADYGEMMNVVIDVLFKRALTTSMLITIVNLQYAFGKWRFSTKSLAEEILQDFNNDAKEDYVNALKEDITKYNKGQCRNFMRHTRKNSAKLDDCIPTIQKESECGNNLMHERYIYEIEYILKKERTKNSKYYKIQEEINKYALKRIHCIPGWKSLTIEELNELRKTYSKLRPFFFKEEVKSALIPKYCYVSFRKCFRLIYEYVKFYTDSKLLNAAYFTLENIYTLYSCTAIVSQGDEGKFCILNDNVIPFTFRKTYEGFVAQCTQALSKIYEFMVNNPFSYWKEKEAPFNLYIDKFNDYLRMSSYMQISSYGSPFRDIGYEHYRLPTLDELIVYNSLWNNYVMISQKKFMNEFLSLANDIDPEFGIIQLSFELIGIDFNITANKELYEEIIQQIEDNGIDIKKEILVNRLLKAIYKDKKYQQADALCKELNNFNLQVERSFSVQTKILKIFKTLLNEYSAFASGRFMQDKWKTRELVNLIYQFIYRNYFGLGKPDILPYSINENKSMVAKFVGHYNLKLFDINYNEDSPWFKIAFENLKKDPRAYDNYEIYKKAYNKEEYKKLMCNKNA